MASALGVLMIVFTLVYMLYILILVKFFKRKKALERHQAGQKLMAEEELDKIRKKYSLNGSRYKVDPVRTEKSRKVVLMAFKAVEEVEDEDRKYGQIRERGVAIGKKKLGPRRHSTNPRNVPDSVPTTLPLPHGAVGRQPSCKIRSSSVVRAISSLSKFTRAAKYVLILLLIFTLAWLPWIVLQYNDLILHNSGRWESYIRENCRIAEMPKDSTVSMR